MSLMELKESLVLLSGTIDIEMIFRILNMTVTTIAVVVSLAAESRARKKRIIMRVSKEVKEDDHIGCVKVHLIHANICNVGFYPIKIVEWGVCLSGDDIPIKDDTVWRYEEENKEILTTADSNDYYCTEEKFKNIIAERRAKHKKLKFYIKDSSGTKFKCKSIIEL